MSDACQPSEAFKSFIDHIVASEVSKTLKRAKDLLRRDLWSAANFDHFHVSGEFRPLIDAIGSPSRMAAPYRIIIDAAINRIIDGETRPGC